MPKCRACGEEIWFIRTTLGQMMPVNEQPVPFVPDKEGKEKFMTEDGVVHHGRKWHHGTGETFYDMGYVSHFATCPEADSFRKRRGKKGDRG